jgi:glutathione S-transferase
VATISLYELIGRDGAHYSQFSWRTRMALAHKSLDFQSVPVRVSDKAAIAFSGQDKVPILKDGDHVVSDSWAIARYLEQTYPDRPSLFGGAIGQGLTRYINTFVDRQLVPKAASMLMLDVLGIVDDGDAMHMRTSMEKAFRKPLEELAGQREADVAEFRRALDPLRATLRGQTYLCGDEPAYADYIVFSVLQWARIVSPFELLKADDLVAAWRERMLVLYGGFARNEPSRLEAAGAAAS